MSKKHLRIPITMCHGVTDTLGIDKFQAFFNIAKNHNFKSISYDQLYMWLQGSIELPNRPVIFDFDHPVISIYRDIFPIMNEVGFTGNLFVNTGPMIDMYSQEKDKAQGRELMTWNELGMLMNAGWTIGGHTHTHPDLYNLALKDPSGDKIAAEMELNNRILEENLGFSPKYFAYAGESFSTLAEEEAKKRYRLARLWITDENYLVNGELMPFSEFVQVYGNAEKDGGPPFQSRYVTKASNPYRLPSMELDRCENTRMKGLVYEEANFEKYLIDSLEESRRKL